MVSLRAASTGDAAEDQLDRLAAADPDADTIPDAEFADDAHRPVVAEKGGSVVGWGSVHLDEDTLAATFVDPDHTGEGIGRALGFYEAAPNRFGGT